MGPTSRYCNNEVYVNEWYANDLSVCIMLEYLLVGFLQTRPYV